MLDSTHPLTAKALYLGHRIDTNALDKTPPLALKPLSIAEGPHGIVILFRYGVAVFFNMTDTRITDYIKRINHCINRPYVEPESDQVELFCDPQETEGIFRERIRLHNYDIQRLQIVADVMAKNVVLGHYETALNLHFDQIEPLAARLGTRQTLGKKGNDLLRHIGEALLIEGKMIARVEAAEKPELIWDYPQYERLFIRLEDEYELTERQRALERKLSLISRTAETLLGILQNQRSLRVEWYIVILIVVEIVITLIEKLA
jgi:uncharacterized Rmd1/YagE family protein